MGRGRAPPAPVDLSAVCPQLCLRAVLNLGSVEQRAGKATVARPVSLWHFRLSAHTTKAKNGS